MYIQKCIELDTGKNVNNTKMEFIVYTLPFGIKRVFKVTCIVG